MVNHFIQNFTQSAHAEGITHLDYYVEQVETASLEVFQEEIRTVEINKVINCYVQGNCQGKCGHYYTENFDEKFIKEGIQNMKQIAEIMGEEFRPIEIAVYEGKDIDPLSVSDELKERILTAEKKARKAFPNVKRFNSHVREVVKRICLQNDKGNYMKNSVTYTEIMVEADAEKEGEVQTSRVGLYAVDRNTIDIEGAFMEAAEEADNLLCACPIQSGRYPVVLKNSIVNEMIGMYITALGADKVHRNLSKFAGMLGKSVASSIVKLEENPALSEGINNRLFDDEGIPTSRKKIIKDGVLTSFLYNREEAGKEGIASTGNGFKPDYKNKAEIHVTNLKLIGEDKTRNELISQMKNGLYIVSCDGMFAGANVVSGDFSLISKGYLIEDGKMTRAVNQITIAGNFFDMLHSIEGISNDYLVIGGETGAYVTPSIYVKELVVSGL